MATTVKQMLDAANAAVPRISAADAKDMMAKGNVLVVDVRDRPRWPRAARCRAPSTFRAACWNSAPIPTSPYHDKSFDKSKTAILYCASGGRSALGGKTLKDMGYTNVFNLGGFKDWVEGGGEVES